MNINDINNRIVEIWDKYKKDDKNVYPPVFYNEIKKGNVVFVGLNPSSVDFDNRKKKGEGLEDLYWRDVRSDIDTYIKKIQIRCRKEECGSKKLYKYFVPIDNMTKCFQSIIPNIGWVHMDIFQCYEKLQNKAISGLYENNELNDFGNAQFEIFKNLLDLSEPKCIVVVNSLASKTIRKEYEIDNSRFNEDGCDYVKVSNMEVPIFFSSMISGQRALDVESRRRLCTSVCNMLFRLENKSTQNNHKCNCSLV